MLRVKYLYSPCLVTTINIHVLTTLKKIHHRFGTSLLFYPRFPVPTLFQSSLLPIVWHWWGADSIFIDKILCWDLFDLVFFGNAIKKFHWIGVNSWWYCKKTGSLRSNRSGQAHFTCSVVTWDVLMAKIRLHKLCV